MLVDREVAPDGVHVVADRDMGELRGQPGGGALVVRGRDGPAYRREGSGGSTVVLPARIGVS
ncbi:MAG: hypothetical protein M3Z25_15210 [Actinomycetota bacterium]|nr:hypothetical protein [Actinomycetota bacterium]